MTNVFQSHQTHIQKNMFSCIIYKIVTTSAKKYPTKKFNKLHYKNKIKKENIICNQISHTNCLCNIKKMYHVSDTSSLLKINYLMCSKIRKQ